MENPPEIPPVQLQAKDPESPTPQNATDASHNDHRSPPAKRRREDKERSRVSRACDRCKKKKTRCTGKCPCSLCLRSGLPCEFTASYTRGRLPSVVVDEAAVAASSVRPRISLPDRDSALETSPQHSSIPSFHTMDRPSTSDIFGSVNRLTVPNDDTSRDPLSRSSPEPSQTDQQGHYVGPSSGVSFLLRIQRRLHQNSDVSHDSSIFTFGDAPLTDFDPSFFVLPPKADAERLIERYFDFAAPTFRFLHRPTIENLLSEFYETQGKMRNKKGSAARTAVLLLVLAQAQAYMPPGSGMEDDSARYYFAAEHQLSKERGAVSLTSVQARLGQCFYLLTQSRINHCWSLFGTTAHLMFAIGLNRGRRSEPNSSIDHVEQESRRRAFWSAYSLDKYLAAALGRPRTFKDEDIDQELPTIVNDSDLHPSFMDPLASRAQSLMMAPIEHIKLSRIISLVLRDLYPIRPPSMAHRIDLAAKYTEDLHSWRANLSRFLDAEGVDTSLLIPLYQRQRNVLNLAYWHAILIVQRPFLISNFASLAHIDHRPGAISNIETSRNIADCVKAAMAIVKIVDELFQGSQIFRAFWFTQYKAFCAVVVLYIYRIQQHYIEPGKCEGYFAAGQKCQAQLSSISEKDCLSKRYCLVLEELRLEALKQTKPHLVPSGSSPSSNLLPVASSTSASADPTIQSLTSSLAVSAPTPQSDASTGFATVFPYGGNIPPTPESAGFSFANNNLMADFTSWGQFDSLVTAGIGSLDGGFQGDFDLGSFGLGN